MFCGEIFIVNASASFQGHVQNFIGPGWRGTLVPPPSLSPVESGLFYFPAANDQIRVCPQFLQNGNYNPVFLGKEGRQKVLHLDLLVMLLLGNRFLPLAKPPGPSTSIYSDPSFHSPSKITSQLKNHLSEVLQPPFPLFLLRGLCRHHDDGKVWTGQARWGFPGTQWRAGCEHRKFPSHCAPAPPTPFGGTGHIPVKILIVEVGV